MTLENKKNYKNLIFDFDGTLVDSYTLMLDVLDDNKLNLSLNFTRGEVENLKDLTLHEIVKKLKVPLTKIPFFVHTVRTELHKHIDRLHFHEGIVDMLKDLKDLNKSLYIVSSNSLENILEFLNNKNLNVFEGIVSDDSIFFKQRSIKKLIKEMDLETNDSIYIGDEVRDIHAGKKANLDVISVTWGFNHEKILREHNPTYLVKYPSEITDIVSDNK